jgi:hypothetical protein
MKTKEEKISALINDMINTLSDDYWHASAICSNGFKGFQNYTEEEINREYAELILTRELDQ